MKAKKILFPTDFSERSEAALRHATSLARENGATLMIAHVREPAETYADTGFAGYPVPQDEAELRGVLHEIEPSDTSVRCVHHLLSGNPADEIIRFAEQAGVDLIVMGTHGRTGLSRLVMGSVAEAVVRGAKSPVLTIKQPEDSEVKT